VVHPRTTSCLPISEHSLAEFRCAVSSRRCAVGAYLPGSAAPTYAQRSEVVARHSHGEAEHPYANLPASPTT
jgi:hypothetical protein